MDTPPPPSTAPTGPLPLVLGVTGHRDLRDSDRAGLEAQVRAIFHDLRQRYSATPLLLLSSLAEGADRLVARVALDFGARLIVPLPMPRSLYEGDFAAPSREEFAQLLARADQVLELPLVAGNTLADIETDGEARNRQYAQAGAYVARHSQVLIALWDGVASDKIGGTSQAIAFKLAGVPEPYGPPQHPLDPVDSGPVYHIVTPRQCHPATEGPPLTLHRRFPSSDESRQDAATAYRRLYQRINAFNQDATRLHQRLADLRRQSKSWLLPEKEAERLPDALQRFLDYFTVADTLAMWFQKRALRSMSLLLLLVFLAAFFFNASDPLGDRIWGRILYVVMLGGAYAVLSWAWWTDYHTKYLDYRALAEGLRVQFFWRLAGLADLVADHYLRKQRSELDWIRDAIRVWNISTAPAPDDRLPLVVNAWVKSQRGYFARAAKRDAGALRSWKWAGNLCFSAGLGWAGLKVFLGSPHPRIDETLKDVLLSDLLHSLVVLISLTPVIAALFYSYTRTRALSEHAKQYSRMAQVFAAAERKVAELLQANQQSQAQALLLDLGKEALLENSDWVQLHRERPMQVPR